MSSVIVAALKKLATMTLTEDGRNGLKKLGVAALALLAAILMPALIAFSSLASLVDSGGVGEVVMPEIWTQQEIILNTLTVEMRQRGFAKRAIEGQVLYMYALAGRVSGDDFVPVLADCFQQDQTDEDLIAAVNAAFDLQIDHRHFTRIMSGIRAVGMDLSGFRTPEEKTNLDLVVWVKGAQRSGWGYVKSTFGRVMNDAYFMRIHEQYPEIFEYEEFIRENWFGKRTADCIGLIKGYCWYEPDTGTFSYKSHGCPDVNQDMLFNAATEKGTIDTMPDIPGLAVWQPGHIGVYIGNGMVIEAKGTLYGVVRSTLSLGSWTHWCKIPYIEYVSAEDLPTDPTQPTMPTEPTQPAEPTQPVPTQPPTPDEPEPVQPTEPPKPTQPEPTEPEPTEAPTEPVFTTPPKQEDPLEPELPTKPVQPIDPPDPIPMPTGAPIA